MGDQTSPHPRNTLWYLDHKNPFIFTSPFPPSSDITTTLLGTWSESSESNGTFFPPHFLTQTRLGCVHYGKMVLTFLLRCEIAFGCVHNEMVILTFLFRCEFTFGCVCNGMVVLTFLLRCELTFGCVHNRMGILTFLLTELAFSFWFLLFSFIVLGYLLYPIAPPL